MYGIIVTFFQKTKQQKKSLALPHLINSGSEYTYTKPGQDCTSTCIYMYGVASGLHANVCTCMVWLQGHRGQCTYR